MSIRGSVSLSVIELACRESATNGATLSSFNIFINQSFTTHLLLGSVKCSLASIQILSRGRFPLVGLRGLLDRSVTMSDTPTKVSFRYVCYNVRNTHKVT